MMINVAVGRGLAEKEEAGAAAGGDGAALRLCWGER